MKRLFVLFALVPVLMLAACTPAEEQAAENEVDTLQTQLADEVREFRMDAEARLTDVDSHLDSLEVEAEAAGDAAQNELNETVAELREERDAIQQDLQQLETSAEAGYRDMRADVERRLNDLESRVEAANADLRDGDDDQQSS